MKKKISIITLGVKDLQKSLEFYRDGLGFKTHNYKENENIVFFEMEGTWLALFPKEQLAKDVGVSAEGSGFNGITLAHNVPSEKDVESTFQLAISCGAKPVKQPQKVFWGGYSGYFSDPDGYLWEVAYNPVTDLT